PSINAILSILLDDGRPGVDEAWALGLQTLDERETFVLHEEVHYAFGVAHKVLKETGDKVGARQTFKDVYSRLLQEARAEKRPVKMQISCGFGKSRHEPVVREYAERGLLPPERLAMLPPPDPKPKGDKDAEEEKPP